MPLKLSTAEQRDKTQLLLRRELGSDVPETANVAAATDLDAATLLEFQGQTYSVPPIPYTLGTRLQALSLDLAWWADQLHRATSDEQAASPDELQRALKTMEGLYTQAVQLCWLLVAKPPGTWLPNWLWRFRRNPFRHASSRELEELLAFFFMCRTRSTVRHSESTPRPARVPLTRLTTLPPS